MSKGINSSIKSHDFIIPNGDTDSISFCRPDFGEFSGEEVKSLIHEMNQVSAEFMDWEDDGYYKCVIVLKAKNYILLKTNKKTGADEIILRGSGLKDSKKEPILRQFMSDIINDLLYQKNDIKAIYERYCDLARNITDISQWAVKKSITKTLLESDRKQETDVVKALGDVSQYREGDKVFVYNSAPVWVPEFEDLTYECLETGMFVPTGEKIPVLYKAGKNKGKQKGKWEKTLKLTKDWDKAPDVEHYLGRIYATLDIFSEVLDMKQFQCYKE